MLLPISSEVREGDLARGAREDRSFNFFPPSSSVARRNVDTRGSRGILGMSWDVPPDFPTKFDFVAVNFLGGNYLAVFMGCFRRMSRVRGVNIVVSECAGNNFLEMHNGYIVSYRPRCVT